ncbi:low-density lipoprotein receptor-related protein 4-like protein [Dinothrombium tinctorium]|uniref:Low-density lipoprotein receptor-related protein 4-like protein n=1 Tax=Dinothrombium tinctorium TaxID=1965070 RepID=A0A3S3QDP9_9ACAR|nr:low-density lipoprotein receptor-related protein 4-like protein [Dinothrombium tinctorium]RWS12855.1 low-density lipoprotein receptor-related protein 4-like protein [Dinothrombium tinctorium]RWS12886.1 low-density lipoprotein receptor-related protein 4-like protein [Dinothrombium tinctorium]
MPKANISFLYFLPSKAASKTCAPDEFRCSSGRCIRSTWRCDGDIDCSDNSDEKDCGQRSQCATGHFRCGDGTCISQHDVCNGAPNCPDGSDEDGNGTCNNGTPCKEDGYPCQHLCIPTRSGHHCACKEGYEIGIDGRSCLDIDECRLKEQICSQRCENTVPGFQCFCAKGYRMRNDKRRCKALGPPPVIIFANRVDIRKVTVDGFDYTAVISDLQNAIAVDFHYNSQLIFWSDITADAIFSATFNGTNVTPIVTAGLISPGGLTIDWISNRLFWTDSGTSRIEFSALDGSMRKVLFWRNVEKPRAIVVDPEESTLFWTDWGNSPRIEKAFIDGTGRIAIVNSSLFWPNGLTIDYPSNRIYWVDAKHHVIESSNFDGTDRKSVIEGNLPHPFAVTVFEDNIYWTDWHTKSIHSAIKLTGEDARIVHGKLHFPMDIMILHPLRQPEVVDRCAGNTCSHICLANNVSYRCACPTGFQLSNDGKTCNSHPDTFLLFSRRNDIRWLCIDCADDSNVDVVLPLRTVNSAVSLDWDYDSFSIFWSDITNDTINRAFWNGSKESVIVSQPMESPSGVAVDWVAHNIYWTDSGRNIIEAAKLDGSMRSIVIWQSLERPRDIVVDSTSALMFWTHWDSSQAKIERSGMDGSQRRVLHSTSLTWPHGLSLDYEEKMLFWSDAGLKRIECSDYNGNRRNTIVSQSIKHPYGLTVFGDYIYWTDWELKSIQKANKRDGEQMETILTGLENLMDIQIFHNKRPQSSNICSKSGCSHLCLLSPSSKGFSCFCPTGIKLLDDKNCARDMQRFLIATSRTSIKRISLDVPYFSDVVVPIKGNLSNALTLDVYIRDKFVFWSDINDDKIYKARYDVSSTAQSIISVGLDDINGLAVDNIGRKIYWSDAGRKRIEVADFDGNNRRVLVMHDLDSPRGIAVDYLSGYMFWADWGSKTRIERSDMDGQKRAIIIDTNLGWPNGLVVIALRKKLVWLDSQMHTLEMSDLNGANRLILANDLPSPYGVANIDENIYWTDWETRAIYTLNLNEKSSPKIILSGLNNIVDIRAVNTMNEHQITDVCYANKASCSHLCLRTSWGYSCACPTGMLLLEDKKTCQSNLTTFLLFASKGSIRRISLDTPDHSDVFLPIVDVQNAVAVDFDYEAKKIYYTDVALDVVRSANFDGSNVVNIVQNLVTPDGLALDWVAKNIYWSDTGRNIIEVARSDGSSRRTIIDLDLDEPRSLAVFPRKALLFWSDWGSLPKIERSYLDGSNRRVIVASGLGWPNGLAVDYEARRLFWADAQLDRIESTDLSGKNRKVVIKDISHPFGVTIYGQHVYWTDWQSKAIERADKETGNDKVMIVENIEFLMELKMVAPSRQADTNPCGNQNGGCSHLCLFRPQGYICACPSHPDSRPCSTGLFNLFFCYI